MFLGLVDKKNQSISVPLKSSELIAAYLRSLVASFRSSMCPHGSLFDNFDDCPKIGAGMGW